MIVRGDARHLPLPDGSVDLVVTSPPYYALRSYTDGGAHYQGQIGSEPTPAEYIDNLIACTREWVRVLKPSGSIWVNLGDKYGGSDGTKGGTAASTLGGGRSNGRPRDYGAETFDGGGRRAPGRPKSLMLLPERYRIACVDQLGLIARAIIIWFKPNGLPESVTDRVRRSHEDWVHLTKQPRYFSAVDQIRQPHSAVSVARAGRNRFAPDLTQVGVGSPNTLDPRQAVNPLGALPGSVWEIPTEPLQVPDHLGVDHFAAFPTEWPRRIILGWSPSGICTACGEGRRPVTATARERSRPVVASTYGGPGRKPNTGDREALTATITGEACACPDTSAPTRPAVVLDPFGGTGTTALVAAALGRQGISVDRSADYCRLAQWRTSDRGELAKAMRVEKPPKQLEGQSELFEVS